jgi:N-acetylglutamate synthase-like GNAT family acetyltransferase
MPALLRLAKKDDAAAIAGLSEQLGYPTNPVQIEARLKQVQLLSDHCVYVAEINQEIVGWIHAFHAIRIESEAFVEIAGLVVDASQRKMGIGRSLIHQVGLWAQNRQLQTIRVRCNVVREESHRFYEKLGFAEVKSQKIFTLQFSSATFR